MTDIVGFHYRWDPQHKQYIHATGLMILTPQGRLSRYFYGVHYEPVDLRLSLVQASGNKVGSVSDQILLLCCEYNPTTGRYDWAVRRVLDVGGAMIMLTLGTLIYRLARHNRRAAGPDAPPSQQT